MSDSATRRSHHDDWSRYSVAIGLLLVIAGASLERLAPALRGNVRFIWAIVMVATISVAVLRMVAQWLKAGVMIEFGRLRDAPR